MGNFVERANPSLIAAAHHGYPSMYRDLFAFSTTAFVIVFAGRLVSNAGFGFFPMWLLSSLACPIVVSVIPRRYILLHTVVTNLGWHLFLLGAIYSDPATPAGVWTIFTFLLAFSMYFAVGVGRIAVKVHASRPTMCGR